MKTLEELRDFINSNDDWNWRVTDIISENNWIDETGSDYGICNDGKRRLQFDSNMEADIVDM